MYTDDQHIYTYGLHMYTSGRPDMYTYDIHIYNAGLNE